MLARRLALPLLLAAVAAAPPAADAARVRHVLDVDDGVTLVTRGGVQTLRFAPTRVFRSRLAGRSADIECNSVKQFGPRVLTGGRSTALERRVPRRGARIRLSDGRPPFALCFIRVRERLVAIATGSELARRHVDDLTNAGRILQLQFAASLLHLLHPKADPLRPFPADEVVEVGRGAFVALESPDATPPVGTAGYWTDGVSRIVTVAQTAAGQRLYLDAFTDRADLSANVFGLIGETEINDVAVALAESADGLRLF